MECAQDTTKHYRGYYPIYLYVIFEVRCLDISIVILILSAINLSVVFIIILVDIVLEV